MEQQLFIAESRGGSAANREETAEQVFTANPAWVNASHERCRQAGLESCHQFPRHRMSGEQIYTLLARHQSLIGYAQLLFGDLYRELSDQTTSLLLTDADGYVLVVHSSPDMVDVFEHVYGISFGVCLGETSCGTTAISLALHHRQPIVLRGEQCYSRLLSDHYCVAAPILSADGRPDACVVICSAADNPLGEKLPLARFVARDLATFQISTHRPAPTQPPASALEAETPNIPPERFIVLTSRQREVLSMFARGLSYKEIARAVGINSVKTVEQHLDAVRTKLGAGSRRECIQRALEYGVLSPS